MKFTYSVESIGMFHITGEKVENSEKNPIPNTYPLKDRFILVITNMRREIWSFPFDVSYSNN